MGIALNQACPDYDNFCAALWSTLAPADPVEEVTAEFVRNAWRLRRCAMAEETLGEIVTAVDRARTSAHNGMRRAKADLDKIQAARKKAQPARFCKREFCDCCAFGRGPTSQKAA